jgi:hypothetical protein
MTVEINDTVDRYLISGTGPYAFSFRIFDEDELALTAIGSDGAPFELTIASHYTVTGVDDEAGGSVTLTSSAASTYSGYTLDIRSNTSEYQPTSIRNLGSFLPEIHEDVFDRLARQIQDLSRKIRGAVRVPDNEILDGETPTVASRKGRYLFANAITGAFEWVTSVATTALNQTIFNQYQADSDTYKRTPFEIEAGITPNSYAIDVTDYSNVMRYVSNTVDGINSQAAAFQSAINIAKISGKDVVVPSPPVGAHYVIDAALDCTLSQADALAGVRNSGFTIRGFANPLAVTQGITTPARCAIQLKHTGHGFDCTGSFGINFENLSITTDTTTNPKTCFFLARNASDGGSIHRFRNVRVLGEFTEAILYNYGAEDDQYDSCQFFNYSTAANAKTVVITQSNIRNLTSTFVTIATGARSTLGHFFNGGAFAHVGGQANADVFHLEAVNLFKMIGPHIINRGGRSHIFVDTTNGGSDGMLLIGVSGENSSPDLPDYGIYVGDTVRTTGSWIIANCRFPNAVNSIKSHANVILDGVNFIDVGNSSAGGGIDVDGTLSGSYASLIGGGISAGSFGENNVDILNKVISASGGAHLTLRDTAGGANLKNFRVRSVGGQLVIAALDDVLATVGNAVVITQDGSAVTQITQTATNYTYGTLPGNYANDAAAAAGGVPIGGVYHNSGAMRVRLS